MLGVQNAVMDTLVRARVFLDENDAMLKGVDLAAARKRLDDIVTTFTTEALGEDVGSRRAKAETAKQRDLRLKLRHDQMEPVALIARRNLRTVPDFKALQMPKPALRGQALLASARGMAEAATAHKDTLIAHGVPTTFLDDFNAAITKLETSLGDREKSLSQRVQATKPLSVVEKDGRTVLGVLDALVRQALGDNQALLRTWESARVIRRRPGRTGAPVPATAPATAPSAAAMPAAATAVAPTPLPVGESTPTAAAA